MPACPILKYLAPTSPETTREAKRVVAPTLRRIVRVVRGLGWTARLNQTAGHVVIRVGGSGTYKIGIDFNSGPMLCLSAWTLGEGGKLGSLVTITFGHSDMSCTSRLLYGVAEQAMLRNRVY